MRHPHVKVIASCGLHTDAGSSTLVAFENAIRAGIEMTETDLRRCADGVILFHDEQIDGRPVADLTRLEMRELTGSLPPTLADFVECCRGRMGIDFELKHGGFEEEVLEAAQANFRPDQYVITSFEPSVLSRVHELAPDAPTGYLTFRKLTYEGYTGPRDTRTPAEVLDLARELHADFVLPDYPDLDLMRACDEAGMDTIAWAVDRADHLRPLLEFRHLRGVIGERPLLMRHLLEEDPDPTYALEEAA